MYCESWRKRSRIVVISYKSKSMKSLQVAIAKLKSFNFFLSHGDIGTLSSLAELETLCLNNVNMSVDLCDIVANCKSFQRFALTRIFTDSCVRRIPLLPEALGLCTGLICLSIIDEGMLFDVLLAALSKLHSIEMIMLCTKQVITDTSKVLSRLISKNQKDIHECSLHSCGLRT